MMISRETMFLFLNIYLVETRIKFILYEYVSEITYFTLESGVLVQGKFNNEFAV